MQSSISIIIVNYNVRAFLEQCLYSVINSSKNLETEIIVVDNNSVDDSVEMLQDSFKDVKLICNKTNQGFAYACNQAIKISTGKYILLLNPDTIIREDSLQLCFDFMEMTSDAGALGVKMIDGKGKFLPESKRSIPTASSAFYKIFGLSKLFPKSKLFGKYQLKYLDENKIHEVEALSGAFMFIRKDILDKIGYLDEEYFMYGEDLDLSYRIIKAGYKNYYFPKTTIIHFKGESTKKSSISYVKFFYNAMLIFSRKNNTSKYYHFFQIFISLAIYIRAAISLFSRFAKAVVPSIFHFSIIYLLYSSLVPVWESYKYLGVKVYSDIQVQKYLIIYITVWILFIRYFKALNPFAKPSAILKAVFWGTIFILAGYSLLPEDSRFSRVVIMIGSTVCFLSVLLINFLFRLIINKGKGFSDNRKKAAILIENGQIAGSNTFTDSFKNEFELKKVLNFNSADEDEKHYISKLLDIIDLYKIGAIIFVIKDFPVSSLIKIILQTQNKNLEYKMILAESKYIIGSQSVINIDTIPGFNLSPVSELKNRIKKRLLDIGISILFSLFFVLFLKKNKFTTFFRFVCGVFMNKLSWISYIKTYDINYQELPELKPGIFTPLILIEDGKNDDKINNEANLDYAKNYKIINDLIIIYKSLKKSFNLNYHSKHCI